MIMSEIDVVEINAIESFNEFTRLTMHNPSMFIAESGPILLMAIPPHTSYLNPS